MHFNLRVDAKTLDLLLEGLGHLAHNRVDKLITDLRNGAVQQMESAAAKAQAPTGPLDAPKPRRKAPRATPKE